MSFQSNAIFDNWSCLVFTRISPFVASTASGPPSLEQISPWLLGKSLAARRSRRPVSLAIEGLLSIQKARRGGEDCQIRSEDGPRHEFTQGLILGKCALSKALSEVLSGELELGPRVLLACMRSQRCGLNYNGTNAIRASAFGKETRQRPGNRDWAIQTKRCALSLARSLSLSRPRSLLLSFGGALSSHCGGVERHEGLSVESSAARGGLVVSRQTIWAGWTDASADTSAIER